MNIPAHIWIGMVDNFYIAPEKIIKIVQVHFDIKPELFNKKTRKQEIVKARKIALYLIQHYSNGKKTLADMAKLVGYDCGSRHSLAIHHINKVKTNMEIYLEWAELVETLKIKCYNYLSNTNNYPSRKTISDYYKEKGSN